MPRAIFDLYSVKKRIAALNRVVAARGAIVIDATNIGQAHGNFARNAIARALRFYVGQGIRRSGKRIASIHDKNIRLLVLASEVAIAIRKGKGDDNAVRADGGLHHSVFGKAEEGDFGHIAVVRRIDAAGKRKKCCERKGEPEIKGFTLHNCTVNVFHRKTLRNEKKLHQR